jgi:hypothetical protein
MSHPNYKENQYLRATEAALEKIHGGIECETFAPSFNLIEAQQAIHSNPELEPDISEILRNLSSNFQVRKFSSKNENMKISKLFQGVRHGNMVYKLKVRVFPETIVVKKAFLLFHERLP